MGDRTDFQLIVYDCPDASGTSMLGQAALRAAILGAPATATREELADVGDHAGGARRTEITTP